MVEPGYVYSSIGYLLLPWCTNGCVNIQHRIETCIKNRQFHRTLLSQLNILAINQRLQCQAKLLGGFRFNNLNLGVILPYSSHLQDAGRMQRWQRQDF